MPLPAAGLLAASLIGGLISAAGSLVGRVLLSLGIGYASYTGISVLLDSLKSQVQGTITGMPADLLPVFYVLKVDVIVSIIFSAVAARFVLMGLTSGTLKRMVVR